MYACKHVQLSQYNMIVPTSGNNIIIIATRHMHVHDE